MESQSRAGEEDKVGEAEIVIIEDRANGEIDIEILSNHDVEVVIVEIVDVEACGRANTLPPVAHRYKVKIDYHYHVFDHRYVTGREILEVAGKTPIDKFELEKRLHGGHYVAVEPTERVDLGECGIEVFETFPLDETEG